MNFLTLQSCKRLETYFQFSGQISNYRLASYLSFFVNNQGNKLNYDDKLTKNTIFTNPSAKEKKVSLEQYFSTVNKDYLVSQSLLTGLFFNHIISLDQSNKLLKNCVDLQISNQKDIYNFMFGTKLNFDIKIWIQSLKKGNLENYDLNYAINDGKLPDQKKKNFFIVFDNKISKYSQFQTYVMDRCKFLLLPNVNKILCLNLQVEDTLKFNNSLINLEGFFKEKSIKIKNTNQSKVPKQFQTINQKKGYRVYKLIEYIYKNIKGNTLLHQFPQYYEFYNSASRQQNAIGPNLNRYSPAQIMLLIQRKESKQAKYQKENQFFQHFKKNFTYRFAQDPYYAQTSTGFIVSRYLSIFNKMKYGKLIQMEKQGRIHGLPDQQQ